MAPTPSQKERALAACRAMSSLGIDDSKVKSVLKKLLKVYDKNWELIEAENYRVLADAIFEDDDKMVCFPLYVLSLSDTHTHTCVHAPFLLHPYFHGWILSIRCPN